LEFTNGVVAIKQRKSSFRSAVLDVINICTGYEGKFYSVQYFVGKSEILSYGLNFGKFLFKGRCIVNLRSNILFMLVEFCTVYRRSKRVTHFSVKSVVYIE